MHIKKLIEKQKNLKERSSRIHEYDHLLKKHEKIKRKIQVVSDELQENEKKSRHSSAMDVYSLPCLVKKVTPHTSPRKETPLAIEDKSEVSSHANTYLANRVNSR